MSQVSAQRDDGGGASAYDTTDELPWNSPVEGVSHNYWPTPRKTVDSTQKIYTASNVPLEVSALEGQERCEESRLVIQGIAGIPVLDYCNEGRGIANEDDEVGGVSYDSGMCSERETFPDTENGTPVATSHLPLEGLPPPARLPLPHPAPYMPIMHPPPGLMHTPMTTNAMFYPSAQFAPQQCAQPPVYWFQHQHQPPAPQLCRVMPPMRAYNEGGNLPGVVATEEASSDGDRGSESCGEPVEEGRRDKMCDEIFAAVETALKLEKRRIREKYLRGDNISRTIEQSAQTSEPDSTSTAAQTLSKSANHCAAESQTPSAQTEPGPAAIEAAVQAKESSNENGEDGLEEEQEQGVCTPAEYKDLQMRSETQLMELRAKNIRLGELNRMKSALELKVRQLESERDQLQATRKDLSNQIGSLEERVKDLTEKLRDKTEEYQTAQRVVDIFKVEVRKWKTEARRVQQRQVQMASCSRCIEFTKLESAYGALQKELRLEQERCSAASRAREELKERLRDYVSPDREGQLLREIDNLTAMHEIDQRSLRKEISQIKEERDRFKIQHAEESHRSSKLMSELKEIRAGRTPVVDNADSWLVEQLDSAAQQHTTEVSELRSQLSKLKSELELTKIQSRQESDNAKMFTSLLQDAESEKERYRLKLIETEDALRRTRQNSSGSQRRLGETPPTSIGHVPASSDTPGSRSKSQFHNGKEGLQEAIGSYPRRSPTEAKSSRASSSDEDEEGALRVSRAVLRR
ncbi:hypothetical protein FOL47_008819 [Perkinsus chesapeaki]|uniref:Uncharacterized protein n=1 Tax=Perkinsus chesapeaki TaxID=330153 RepID=A0A7J6LBW3_PERCH|nr:hypothetical protein FOL47_008819 [Perkinsus chesapeaki]